MNARGLHPAAVVLALLAMAGSAYLGWTALGASGLPPGCGAGDGCGEVLGSPWARWYGLPVAGLAVGVYAGLAVALLLRWRQTAVFFASLAIGGALWFVLLQAMVLRAFCAYCMADHALGLLAAACALIWAGPRWQALIGGLAGTLLFAGLHLAQPQAPYQLRAPGPGDADFRDAQDRRILALLEGAFLLEVADNPLIGSPDATQIVAALVDYACPHCRELHHALADHQAAHPDQLAVLVVPVPVHPACNPSITHEHDRFAESCEIASISLGVYRLAPDAWPAFDLWLFDLNRPRRLEEVRAYVRDSLDLDPHRAQAHPRVRADLRRNVAAYAALPVEDERERRVPVLLAAGHPPIIGPAGSIDQLPHLTPNPPTQEQTE